MRIAFTSSGWADCTSWAGDQKALARINRLITGVACDPGAGAGKPERLSGDLSGCWSPDQERRRECAVRVVIRASSPH